MLDVSTFTALQSYVEYASNRHVCNSERLLLVERKKDVVVLRYDYTKRMQLAHINEQVDALFQ